MGDWRVQGTICSKRNEARNGATENQIDDCIQFLPCFILNVLFLTLYRLYKGERQNTDSFVTNKHFSGTRCINYMNKNKRH